MKHVRPRHAMRRFVVVLSLFVLALASFAVLRARAASSPAVKSPTSLASPACASSVDASETNAANGKIAFMRDDFGGGGIYVMNPDGSNRLLVNPAGSQPAFSPDGTKIAYTIFHVNPADGPSQIYVMSADGCNPVNVSNNHSNDASPTWSPDGTKIAFASNRDHASPNDPEEGVAEIYVMNADGSNQTRLTFNPDNIGNIAPAWSPDGTKIVFESGDVEGTFDDIFVINADGSNRTRLTNNTVLDEDPAWSPDGTKITFMRAGTISGSEEIFVMNADGSNQTRLTNNAVGDIDPTWSPDGTKIAFTRFETSSAEIYVMNANGSNQTRLTTTQSFNVEVAWQPLPANPTTTPTPIPTPTPSGYVTLTFDELATQPAKCVRIGGVSFDFQPNVNDSANAFYGDFVPSANFEQGRALTGDARGALTLNFAVPTSFLRFGVLLNTADTLTPGFTVQLFDASSNSLGTFLVNTQSPFGQNGPSISENQFTYSGTPASRAVITFSTAGTRFGSPTFALDNLTFDRSTAPKMSTVQFAPAAYSVAESAASVSLNVTRTGDLSTATTVGYATLDNPAPIRCDQRLPVAFARCDYATTVGTVTFAAGETQKTIKVPLINDAHPEDAETINVQLNDTTGDAGLGAQSRATITISDDDVTGTPNPIFNNSFFVRMQYLDFLSREPEAGEPWTGVLNNCATNDPSCDRISVSANFFRSQEFQLKGLFVFRFYKVAFNRMPLYSEIIPDMASITGTTTAELQAKKAAYTSAFAQRQEFKNLYDGLTNQQFVDALMNRYNLQSITTINPSSPDDTTAARVTFTRADLVNRLNAATLTRAQVVRAIADSNEVGQTEFNPAFVAMQYFGYLRRDPEPQGYNAWLATINANPNDFRSMVNGFMNSTEYRLRFGQP